MLGGALMKRLYELHGRGVSIRRIAAELGIARNTVRTYLRAEGVPTPKPRPKRGSCLDPFASYLDERMAAGVTNCVVLLRELRGRGYAGSYALLTAYVRPRRRPRQPKATVRFETAPGQQAQVDFGQCRYAAADGTTKQVWVFVVVLSWSRAIYVEFVARADEVTFLRCHHHAFVAFGGIPRTCLYDNTKLVVLDRDGDGEPIWQRSFLDFCRRLDFTPRLCQPYRPRTKGRVERGIDYVKENFWPSARFTDLLDLNAQAQGWVRTVADVRIHGTTGERPAARLARERPHLQALPAAATVAPLLREVRKVGRDGFVRWDGSSYGVPWRWAGHLVGVQASATVVEVWAGEERLAVHPRATRPHQRFVLPGQWDGLPLGDARPPRDPLAIQLPTVEVEARSLGVYDALVGEGQ
jgi:transposase